jgi:hypothetical protein
MMDFVDESEVVAMLKKMMTENELAKWMFQSTTQLENIHYIITTTPQLTNGNMT